MRTVAATAAKGRAEAVVLPDVTSDAARAPRGSRGPEEIALSILAEIVAARRRGPGPI